MGSLIPDETLWTLCMRHRRQYRRSGAKNHMDSASERLQRLRRHRGVVVNKGVKTGSLTGTRVKDTRRGRLELEVNVHGFEVL